MVRAATISRRVLSPNVTEGLLEIVRWIDGSHASVIATATTTTCAILATMAVLESFYVSRLAHIEASLAQQKIEHLLLACAAVEEA